MCFIDVVESLFSDNLFACPKELVGTNVHKVFLFLQARFLLAKLNPSATYNSDASLSGGDVIFTDDVSFDVFLDHLQRLAVQ
jgi:hypothetical protein